MAHSCTAFVCFSELDHEFAYHKEKITDKTAQAFNPTLN